MVDLDIPVVILCGGKGTRLVDQMETRPKPLVEVGGRPLLWHIMKHYWRYGFGEFILALGYKGREIKKSFLDYRTLGSNLSISLQDGRVDAHDEDHLEPWKIHLIDTGQETLTGGRLNAV